MVDHFEDSLFNSDIYMFTHICLHYLKAEIFVVICRKNWIDKEIKNGYIKIVFTQKHGLR